ncbi:MAG: hypothetical protein JKY15_02225 [Deltaproteobacteria bacterium]|nr:hypothetical protein [Deltaproteobacteria bacterium]
MVKQTTGYILSSARLERRQAAAKIANSLVGSKADSDFNPVSSPLCALDVVMIAGAPWLREALEKDFYKDESGYRKIGGGANTPEQPYFFRSTANLIHFSKRQNLYSPRGSKEPAVGMACFFNHNERGRFNFVPDRSGIITEVYHSQAREVILAEEGLEVKKNADHLWYNH